jgi:hypothetical protein
VVIVAVSSLASGSRSNRSLDEYNIPSKVADFRVLHAHHAISTAGDPLRGIVSVVHLDGGGRTIIFQGGMGEK